VFHRDCRSEAIPSFSLRFPAGKSQAGFAT
jgi:hypothetical protein